MSTAGALLVVDDDVMVRDVVGRYLGRAGYQVMVAGDGEQALRMAETDPPDLVILDLMLELGADDYITKPFSPRELVLRVRSVLRRARTPQPVTQVPPVTDDGLIVDIAARRAVLDGQELALTVREFELLAFLIRHPGRAFTRSELLEQVWG